MDKIWIKMCLIPKHNIKTHFYVLLHRKSSPKLALGKISSINFCKIVQIMKKHDTFRQGMLLFHIKPREHFSHS